MSNAVWKRRLRTVAIWAGLAAVIYFGNVEVQSWMGRRAVEATGIEMVELDEAFARAAADEKLVLADLSAIWCSTCRRLDQKVFSDPRVRDRINGQFVFSRIEYESDEGVAFRERYGVKGFPVLLVLDAEGEAVGRLPVVFDADRFLEILIGFGERDPGFATSR